MLGYEELFHQIAREIPDGSPSKMFGANCIKTSKGKACAIYWKEAVLVKLDDAGQLEALNLNGARQGMHLYDPTKPMKGWILLPAEQSELWSVYIQKALNYVRD